MLSISLLFLVLSIAHPESGPANPAALELGLPPSAKEAPTAATNQGFGEGEARGDLIFSNGFETGTYLWTDAASFSLFETTAIPSLTVGTCNLLPGDYVFRLEAGNGAGAHTYEYPLTVTEVPCDGDPLSDCLDLAFGDPTITFQ